ncbi:hypothetical protein [Mycoplasma elephantis]|uniref:hypothetical protein n=1 Tax=Mycoplasma elephantis TaxID=114882 RepID=UPI000A96C221|nr:hypothetical protein [Mycoplasma elephantis]
MKKYSIKLLGFLLTTSTLGILTSCNNNQNVNKYEILPRNNENSNNKQTSNSNKHKLINRLSNNMQTNITFNGNNGIIKYEDSSKKRNYLSEVLNDIEIMIKQNSQLENIKIFNSFENDNALFEAKIENGQVKEIKSLIDKQLTVFTNFEYKMNKIHSFSKFLYNSLDNPSESNIALFARYEANLENPKLSLLTKEWSGEAFKRTYSEKGWETSFARYLAKDNIDTRIEDALIWTGVAEVRYFENNDGIKFNSNNEIIEENFMVGRYKCISNPANNSETNIGKPPLEATYYDDKDDETNVKRIYRERIKVVTYDSSFNKQEKEELKLKRTTVYLHDDNPNQTIDKINKWNHTIRVIYDSNGNINSKPTYYEKYEENTGKSDLEAKAWGMGVKEEYENGQIKKIYYPLLTLWTSFNEYNQPISVALYDCRSEKNIGKDIENAIVWQNVAIKYEYDSKHRLKFEHDLRYLYVIHFEKRDGEKRLDDLRVVVDGEEINGQKRYIYDESKEYIYDDALNLITDKKQYNVSLSGLGSKQFRTWLRVKYQYNSDNQIKISSSYSSELNLKPDGSQREIDDPEIKRWGVRHVYEYGPDKKLLKEYNIWSVENILIKNDKRFANNNVTPEMTSTIINAEDFASVNQGQNGQKNGLIGFYNEKEELIDDIPINTYTAIYADKARFDKNEDGIFQEEEIEDIYINDYVQNPNNQEEWKLEKIVLTRESFYKRYNKAKNFVLNIIRDIKKLNTVDELYFKDKHFTYKYAFDFFLKVIREKEFIQLKTKDEVDKFWDKNREKSFIIWSELSDLETKIPGVKKIVLNYDSNNQPNPQTKESKSQFVYVIKSTDMDLDYELFKSWHLYYEYYYFELPGYKPDSTNTDIWDKYTIRYKVQYNRKDFLKGDEVEEVDKIDKTKWTSITFEYKDPRTGQTQEKIYSKNNPAYNTHTIEDILKVYKTYITSQYPFRKG